MNMKNRPHSPYPAIWLAVFLLVPGSNAVAAAKGSPVLAATIFPAADIARRIAGNDARVIQILPAGSSPHTFELTPGLIRELQPASIIFKIGGIDDWIDSIGESLPRVAIVALDQNIARLPFHKEGHGHSHGKSGVRDNPAFDPHYWLNAENGIAMAKNIMRTLSAAHPDRASLFEANYREYARQLGDLHKELQKRLSLLKNNKMIVFHDAWRYFASAYGLEIAAVFQTSPGREPAPRDMQELYAQVKRYGIKVIFSEPQLPTASLEPLLQDLGLKLVVLDPLGGSAPEDSYMNLLRRNARAIIRALGH